MNFGKYMGSRVGEGLRQSGKWANKRELMRPVEYIRVCNPSINIFLTTLVTAELHFHLYGSANEGLAVQKAIG